MPGNYRVEVLRVFRDKDSAGKSYFVVETLVIKSDNPKISIGDEREWICPWEYGPHLNRIKAFVGKVSGYHYHLKGVGLPLPLVNCGQIVDVFGLKEN